MKPVRLVSLYGRGIRAILPLAFIGWLVLILGFARKHDLTIRFGTALFLGAFALWGFTNGGAMAWGLGHSFRAHRWKPWREQPLSSALYLLLTVFFLAVGGCVSWFIVRVCTAPPGSPH